MGNIVTTIKRFLGNKNTVTILGVLVGIIVLYIGYNFRVRSAIKTIDVPVAKKTITATQEITADDVSTISVLQDSLNKNVIRSRNNLLSAGESKCVTYGTSIPAGAYFFSEQIVNCNAVPNDPFKNMPDGYQPVELPVDIHSTYGNALYPGDKIALYVRMTSDDNKVLFGKLIDNIEIADVRDSRGNSVFLTSQAAEPSSLLFTLPDEYFLLLRRALYTGKVEFIPVPGNASYTASKDEIALTSEDLKDRINQYVADIQDQD